MDAAVALRPLPLGQSGTSRGIQYYEYECVECGSTARNTYMEPHCTDMAARRLCWTCNFWRDFEEKHEGEATSMTIINGHVYAPGNNTSGEFRGMAGRRFDIEYIAQSIYAGQKITTFDLWSGSVIPDALRAKFPDTARFLGGAEKASAGGIACWNSSDRQAEPYPLPETLRPNAIAAAEAEAR